jgi:hypothetical protein
MSIHLTRGRILAATAAATAAMLLAACNGTANSDSDSGGDGDSSSGDAAYEQKLGIQFQKSQKL